MQLEIGDWVQAVVSQTEPDFLGEETFIHADPGGIGHVLDELPDGSYEIFFEKTGTITVVHGSELTRLCNAVGEQSDLRSRI